MHGETIAKGVTETSEEQAKSGHMRVYVCVIGAGTVEGIVFGVERDGVVE